MAETTEKPHHYQVRSVDTSITMQQLTLQPALDIKKAPNRMDD